MPNRRPEIRALATTLETVPALRTHLLAVLVEREPANGKLPTEPYRKDLAITVDMPPSGLWRGGGVRHLPPSGLQRREGGGENFAVSEVC